MATEVRISNENGTQIFSSFNEALRSTGYTGLSVSKATAIAKLEKLGFTVDYDYQERSKSSGGSRTPRKSIIQQLKEMAARKVEEELKLLDAEILRLGKNLKTEKDVENLQTASNRYNELQEGSQNLESILNLVTELYHAEEAEKTETTETTENAE